MSPIAITFIILILLAGGGGAFYYYATLAEESQAADKAAKAQSKDGMAPINLDL